MKRLKKPEGDQLPIDELMPEAPAIVRQIHIFYVLSQPTALQLP